MNIDVARVAHRTDYPAGDVPGALRGLRQRARGNGERLLRLVREQRPAHAGAELGVVTELAVFDRQLGQDAASLTACRGIRDDRAARLDHRIAARGDHGEAQVTPKTVPCVATCDELGAHLRGTIGGLLDLTTLAVAGLDIMARGAARPTLDESGLFNELLGVDQVTPAGRHDVMREGLSPRQHRPLSRVLAVVVSGRAEHLHVRLDRLAVADAVQLDRRRVRRRRRSLDRRSPHGEPWGGRSGDQGVDLTARQRLGVACDSLVDLLHETAPGCLVAVIVGEQIGAPDGGLDSTGRQALIGQPHPQESPVDVTTDNRPRRRFDHLGERRTAARVTRHHPRVIGGRGETLGQNPFLDFASDKCGQESSVSVECRHSTGVVKRRPFDRRVAV